MGGKKRHHSNPLAQARGNQKDPSLVWHRRTKAGFRLFIQYYANQPSGCCYSNGADNISDDDKNHKINDAAPKMDMINTGNSRAARKRKRKKGHNKLYDKDTNIDDSSDYKTNNYIDRIENNIEVNNSTRTFVASTNLKDRQTAGIQNNATQHKLLLVFVQMINDGSTSLSQKQQQSDQYRSMLSFVSALSRPLPISVRFRLCNDTVAIRQDIMQQQQRQYNTVDDLHMLHVLPFGRKKIFQQKLHYNSRSTIDNILLSAKNYDNNNKQAIGLKKFLLQHAQNGNLARQEIGSMLPVLMLQYSERLIQSSPLLIDLCASPGSKTLQALEIVGGLDGVVIANDINPLRLQALKDAVQRSGVPNKLLKRVHYTNQDAAKFVVPAQFDNSNNIRIVLCDVPCSGDGTVRKDPHVLPSWSPSHGNTLHSLQLSILLRGLDIITGTEQSTGNVLCYSTCSLNPVENEAVVAAALENFNSKGRRVMLTACPDFVGLVLQPGLSYWNVADYKLRGSNTDAFTDDGLSLIDNDDKKDNSNNKHDDNEDLANLTWYRKPTDQSALPATLWPQESYAANLQLHLCRRLLPQDQDTGGFFLALFTTVVS